MMNRVVELVALLEQSKRSRSIPFGVAEVLYYEHSFSNLGMTD